MAVFDAVHTLCELASLAARSGLSWALGLGARAGRGRPALQSRDVGAGAASSRSHERRGAADRATTTSMPSRPSSPTFPRATARSSRRTSADPTVDRRLGRRRRPPPPDRPRRRQRRRLRRRAQGRRRGAATSASCASSSPPITATAASAGCSPSGPSSRRSSSASSSSSSTSSPARTACSSMFTKLGFEQEGRLRRHVRSASRRDPRPPRAVALRRRARRLARRRSGRREHGGRPGRRSCRRRRSLAQATLAPGTPRPPRPRACWRWRRGGRRWPAAFAASVAPLSGGDGGRRRRRRGQRVASCGSETDSRGPGRCVDTRRRPRIARSASSPATTAAFVTAVLAAAKVGADIVYLNTSFAGPQLADVVAREGVDVIVHDDEFAPLVAHCGDIAADRRRASSPRSAPQRSFVPLDADAPRRSADHPDVGHDRDGRRARSARRRRRRRRSAGLLDVPFRARDTVVIAAPLFHAWGLAHLGIVARARRRPSSCSGASTRRRRWRRSPSTGPTGSSSCR